MKQKQEPNRLTKKDNLVELIFANTTKALNYFPFTLFTFIFLSFKALFEAEHDHKGRTKVLKVP